MCTPPFLSLVGCTPTSLALLPPFATLGRASPFLCGLKRWAACTLALSHSNRHTHTHRHIHAYITHALLPLSYSSSCSPPFSFNVAPLCVQVSYPLLPFPRSVLHPRARIFFSFAELHGCLSLGGGMCACAWRDSAAVWSDSTPPSSCVWVSNEDGRVRGLFLFHFFYSALLCQFGSTQRCTCLGKGGQALAAVIRDFRVRVDILLHLPRLDTFIPVVEDG